jgi:integrase
MTRRGPNEGSIYQRESDGRWLGVLHIGYAGEKRQRRVYYGRTRAEVVKKLAGAQRTQDDGLPLPAERLTVGAFLDRWLKSVKPALRPNTYRRYEQFARLHISPALGRISLAKLTPDQLQGLYASKLEAGLSPTTVRHIHAAAHKALKQATRWGLVVRNVASVVEAPRMAHHEMTTLSPDEAQRVIEAACGERLGAVYTLALTTGMRRGELLGLRWRDVDLERGAVQVRASLQWTKEGPVFGEPKTERSRRQITLAKIAIDTLRAHRIAQAEERLRRGGAWEDNDLVFANEVGRPVHPNNMVRRSFEPLLRRAGVPRVRFHDLRHSAATLLLAQGVHPKIVSEMLGHSQIAMTLDLYSHVTPTMQRQAADAMDAVLRH